MGKVYDGIMGLVVGDALGVPFEFRKRDTFKAVDMVGYGLYNQPPGTWSDDSSLTLATLESIGRTGMIDTIDIMVNFSCWLGKGRFTPYGQVFDVGGTTRAAIERFQRGVEPLKCGGDLLTDNGNGSLMRILPLAFANSSYADVVNVSSLTHAHPISKRACLLYVIVAEQLMKGKSLSPILTDEMWGGEFRRLSGIWEMERDEVKSSGYVVDTLEAALWCLYHTDTYRDCVLTAVNLGGDTDTIAAVAGGLAGIMYGCGGENGIPEAWINQIPRKDFIKDLCEKVESKFSRKVQVGVQD